MSHESNRSPIPRHVLSQAEIIELGKASGREVLERIDDTGYPKDGFDNETIRRTHEAMADAARLTLTELQQPLEPQIGPEDVDDSL